jgi:hypothetical protein
VVSYQEKCEELQHKLTELGESNRIITQVYNPLFFTVNVYITHYSLQAMRLKQEELSEMGVKYAHLLHEAQVRLVCG